MTNTVPEIFDRYAGALTDLVSAVTTAMGSVPGAAYAQDERVRAWLTETRRYVDAGFWEQAKEVHASHLHAEAVQREAAAERERSARIGAARTDAHSAAQGLTDDHPRPAFPKPKH